MTIETYNKATKILKEKEQLEAKLLNIKVSCVDFSEMEEYSKICERLFVLGNEFAAL